MAAVSARREVMCGYVVLCLLLWLLCQLEENKRVCSTYGSSRVNSKTTDDTNRMKSNTTSLPPSASSHPSELSQTTGFQLPASYSKFPLCIYVTYGNICVSMLLFQFVPPSPSPTVSTSLFSTSASPVLPCKQILPCYLSRLHIYALIYNIYFSLSGLLHSVHQALGSSTSLELTQMSSFLWLSNIPFNVCTMIYLSIHLLIDTQVASMSQIL